MHEMEISLRQANNENNAPKDEVLLSIFKLDTTTKFNTIKISPCPEWLGDACTKCGKKASSSFYEDGTPTAIEIDDDIPLVFCDECRESLFLLKERPIIEKEIPPNKYKLILRGRIEWSINRETWYSVRHGRLIPISNIIKNENELIRKTNILLNKIYRGSIVKGKAKYTKETKILEINIDSFA